MKIEYKLSENDFLEFHLYEATQSDSFKKDRRKRRNMVAIGAILVSLIFLLSNDKLMAVYFSFMAIASIIFYEKFHNNQYKKNILRHIRENYSKRINQTAILEINEETMFSNYGFSEGKINIDKIENVSETSRHFFIKMPAGGCLIIPKKFVQETDTFKQKFSSLGVPVETMIDWTWK